jgi:hypothetical protein
VPRDTRARSKAPAADSGKALEARVAQVWFWEGAFARRGVDLQRHFHPDPLLVTDLDLLAIEIDTTLQLRRTIGEAKTGTSKTAPKPLDRVIWLRGLMEVTGAHAAELTSELVPSNRVRQLGESLGVHAQSTRDLEKREGNLRLDDVADKGVFGVKWLSELDAIRRTCSGEQELERAYWFLRSEVWFLDPFSALKRILTAMRLLASRWTPDARDDHEFAVRWLLCEATAVATLNLVGIAGFAVRREGAGFDEFVDGRLAEGSVPMHQMRAMSKSFDSYLTGVLSELGASKSAIVQALGAFEPKAPDYAPAVAELARRLAAGASHARHLPRWADIMTFERVLRDQEPTTALVGRLGLAEPSKVAHAGRLVATFLKAQGSLPLPFVSALGSEPHPDNAREIPPPEGDRSSQSSDQLSLPDP